LIKKLKRLLSKKDKQFLFFLFIFSIFISLIETIGISIIMPFISVASDFSSINDNKYYSYIYNLFNFKNEVSFVVVFGIVIICFYIFRSVVNLVYFYLLARFSKGRYHLLAYRLFENYLGMSYQDFINRNSSELNKSLINEVQNLTQLISGILFILSEVLVVIFIYSVMIYIDFTITILLTVLLVINSGLLVRFISPKIKQAGIDREKYQKSFYKIISNVLGNFKIMKLKSNSDEIMKEFAVSSLGFAKANIKNETFSHFPRLFLEALGFAILAIIIIYQILKYDNDISHVLPEVTMFVLGLYRLMPSANRIIKSYNQILYYSTSLDIVYHDIMFRNENLASNQIIFNNSILLNNIKFEYLENKPILNNFNLEIKKGSSIAFVGKSGSGKSTLVDLIIGLYRPVSGEIKIDNTPLSNQNIKLWRRKVGYIPQTVYLFDGSVSQNVAFGNDINEKRVKEVLTQANILDFLESHQNGINTIVGEGGIKLSGGQKQRIAIARALYDNPELLILDEATSALDDKTEKKIMTEIYKIAEDKTLIIIAHRLSTITGCDKIYKLENGELINV
jgi:ABC-type multidrug transport system fused ATPase/permease subunit